MLVDDMINVLKGIRKEHGNMEVTILWSDCTSRNIGKIRVRHETSFPDHIDEVERKFIVLERVGL